MDVSFFLLLEVEDRREEGGFRTLGGEGSHR